MFGSSVSISGDYAIAGANNDVIGSNDAQGSAYIFYRNEPTADNWGQLTKITASDGAANDQFSNSAVSISGDYAIIGSRNDDSSQGSAYLMEY